MEKNSKVEFDPTKYDFMKRKELVNDLLGYGMSKSVFYRIYIFILLLCFFCTLSMSAHCMYLSYMKGNVELIINGTHVFLTGTFFIWGVITKLLTEKSLQKARHCINSGFYQYPDEVLDEEQIKMMKQGVATINKQCNAVAYAMTWGIVSNLIFYPFSQYSNVPQDKYEEVVDIANPYVPHTMHPPFSTKTLSGFMGVYLFNILHQCGINGITITMSEIYISSWGQLKIQLQILNYSLRNIQYRAFLLYSKHYRSSVQGQIMTTELWENSDYKRCLYKCLKSNIEHHIYLLRYEEHLKGYCGSCLLIAVLIASIVFASSLVLIMLGPPTNLLLHYSFVLIGEQFYAFFLCYIGEQIMQESRDLFESLYAVPWFNCSKSFTNALRIFMSNTINPIKVKCLVLEVVASIEIYGAFLSTMYKMVNVLRTFFE